MTTVAKKRGRARKFDWDEAVRRHQSGETKASIARAFAVSEAAIARAVDPDVRARDNARAVKWNREHNLHQAPCVDCGAPATGAYRPGARCMDCYRRRLASAHVRDDALRCASCDEWKPDAAFAVKLRGTANGQRRGRRSQCTACESAARREHRARAAS